MDFGFHKISAEQYHADKLAEQPALSSSIAKILLRGSALQAWHAHPRLNPAFKESHEDKFDIGKVSHSVLLEGDESKLVVVQADDWRTNKAKEERENARATGKTALLAKQAAGVSEMVKAAKTFLVDCEITADWKNGESELTGLVEDDGVMLKARFDRITHDRKVIIDYKTTDSAEPDIFGMQIARLGYHWQEAFYRRVANLLGAQSPIFVFLAQSVEPPYECSLHGCDPALQEISEADVKHAIAIWRDCLEKDEWRSYGGRIYWTMPTSWMMSAHEQRLQEAA